MTNDEWYLEICNVVAKKSKCFSRKVGAIVVKDKSIIVQGYNGPPRDSRHCDTRHWEDDFLWEALHNKYPLMARAVVLNDCPRRLLGFKSGEGLEYCIAGHSERNCITNAARHGIKLKGGIMYMSCSIPCSPCLVEIINAGIKEIVCTSLDTYDREAAFVCKNKNLKVRVYNGN